MLEKLLKIYKTPQKTEMIDSNDRVYAQFLERQFNGASPDADEKEYDKVFQTLISSTEGNEKIFSQLKHMCYDLSGHIARAGEVLHKIAGVVESHLQSEDAFYKKIRFQPSEKVTQMNKRLLAGLSEWGSQLIIQKKFVIDNMASFFHYKKHEGIHLSRLLASDSNLQSQCRKRVQKLHTTKLKLFESKDIEKMQIDTKRLHADLNFLIKKYETICDYILPAVGSSGNARSRFI